MGRIRSIHPGQWTDEDFVECGFAARLLAIGIRNEADDNGVFEWKPVGLKMRLFPADPVDINELLLELVAANQIMRFEVEGRVYGAIRNFCLFQSPKSPKAQFPLTPDVRNYVGITVDVDTPARKGPGRPRKNAAPDNSDGCVDSFPRKIENNSNTEKSFPRKIENNSQRERRGEENNNNLPPTANSRAKIETGNGQADDGEPAKPQQAKPQPPGNIAAPNPNFQAFLRASGMASFPNDLGNMLREWEESGIDFEGTVLPVVRAAAKRVRDQGGRQPFKARFFDQFVREEHATSERNRERWRGIPDEVRAADQASRKARIDAAMEDLKWARDRLCLPPDHPSFANTPLERVTAVEAEALANLAALGVPDPQQVAA